MINKRYENTAYQLTDSNTNKTKGFEAGVSVKNRSYSYTESEQDGMKVVLEFPEFENAGAVAEVRQYQLEIQKEVGKILAHTLKEQVKNHQIYHTERIS